MNCRLYSLKRWPSCNGSLDAQCVEKTDEAFPSYMRPDAVHVDTAVYAIDVRTSPEFLSEVVRAPSQQLRFSLAFSLDQARPIAVA